MNEKPLERLNYYNGQRLEASDFKTEQEYHIRTRRWLNKSLYTAGIARGLEVRSYKDQDDKKAFVAVSPGLALDNEGREIILLEETPVEVCSYAGTNESTVVGNYLVIEYAEETIAYEKGGCAVRTEGTSVNKSTTNWGGPSRIQAQVKFSWVPFVPHPGSNQIVLAQVELKTGCSEVNQIDPGARRYIGAASAATVKQYALEGEREVACLPRTSFPDPKPSEDVEVIGRIYFHIRGRQPNSVTLYLKSESFSKLYYTEIGQHAHTTSGETKIPDHSISIDSLSHIHELSHVITDIEKQDDVFPNDLSPHNHNIRASFKGPFDEKKGMNAIQLAKDKGLGFMRHRVNRDPNNDQTKFIIEGEHRHRLIADGVVGTQGSPYTDTPVKDKARPITAITLTHSSPTEQPSIDPAGATFQARVKSADPLDFVDDLRVLYRNSIGNQSSLIDLTDGIIQQIIEVEPRWKVLTPVNKRLGNGTANHPFVTEGTGAIRLDFLSGLVFSEGAYCLELRVRKERRTIANGGKIHYNLYIE